MFLLTELTFIKLLKIKIYKKTKIYTIDISKYLNIDFTSITHHFNLLHNTNR